MSSCSVSPALQRPKLPGECPDLLPRPKDANGGLRPVAHMRPLVGDDRDRKPLLARKRRDSCELRLAINPENDLLRARVVPPVAKSRPLAVLLIQLDGGVRGLRGDLAGAHAKVFSDDDDHLLAAAKVERTLADTEQARRVRGRRQQRRALRLPALA